MKDHHHSQSSRPGIIQNQVYLLRSQVHARLRAGRELAEDTTASRAGLGLVAVKNGQQALPHLAGLLAGVDSLPDARLLVVADDRSSLLVVGSKTLLKSFGVVVAALDQRLAGDVVRHGLLGRVEGSVVRPPAGRVHKTARDARHEQRVVDLELYGMLESLVALAKHGVETLCLRDSAGEAVENEAIVRKVIG